jgi:hypothetical protein
MREERCRIVKSKVERGVKLERSVVHVRFSEDSAIPIDLREFIVAEAALHRMRLLVLDCKL